MTALGGRDTVNYTMVIGPRGHVQRSKAVGLRIHRRACTLPVAQSRDEFSR